MSQFGALDVQAQDKPLKKIRWGVTALSASNWIPWIAKDAKIYEKNGLDVELVLLRGSGQTSAAIVSGSIFGAPVTTPTVMLADLGGADLVTVAHTVPGVQTKLLVRPEIRKPEDLKGKKIGISSLGSLGDFLERYIMRKHGLEPGRDVILISVGGPPEVLQALMSGVIDGGDLSYPVSATAEKQGFRVLWDARKEVVYPSMSVVTRRKNIQEDRDTVMRMVKSHVEGIAYFKTHKDFSLKSLEQVPENHRPGTLGRLLRNLQRGFHIRALSDHARAGGHLRLRRRNETGDPGSQARRVHGLKLHRRAGQERVYQEAVRTEIGNRH